MARLQTDSGKTFNMRGLRRRADTAMYEFAYEMEGGGAKGGVCRVRGDQAQFKVPEGTLVVAAPGEACILVTASPDENAALGEQESSNYHLYRLTRLGQL